MSGGQLGVVMPFWFDRPDEEAVEIALAAEQAGDRDRVGRRDGLVRAFALATAIGSCGRGGSG